MTTATRCAPGEVRTKIIKQRQLGVLLAIVAAFAATGWTSTARAEFDDGSGACASDWSASDSSGCPATGSVDFNVDAAGCFDAGNDGCPISLTGELSPDACDGMLLSQGGDQGFDGSGGGAIGGDHGFHLPFMSSGHISPDTVKLPEPGTFALLALAAGGLLTRRGNKGFRA
jgi:hypothetical protein